MTTLDRINGTQITESPESLAAAKAEIARAVEDHNAKCPVAIRARIATVKVGAGVADIRAQVGIASAKGRVRKWLDCPLLSNVPAFAAGIADALAPGGHAKAPERDFAGHTDEAAYFYGGMLAPTNATGPETAPQTEG